MSEIDYSERIEYEELDQYTTIMFPVKVPLLARIVMKCSGGKIKTLRRANKALLLIAGLLFVLSFFFFRFSPLSSESPRASKETQERQERAMEEALRQIRQN